MNQKPVSVPLIIACVAILALVVYFVWPKGPTTTPEQASNTTGTPGNTVDSTPSNDTMTATAKAATMPFTSVFTLYLNSNRSCSPVTYTIDFGDNIRKDVQIPQNQCANPYSVTVSHQYERAGDYTALLSTKPTAGASTTLARIAIFAKEPVVKSGVTMPWFTASPAAGASPLTIAFALLASDSASSAVSYKITYGDGQSESFSRVAAPKVSHVYTSAGAFVVSVSKQTQCTATQCTGPTTPVGTITVNVD